MKSKIIFLLALLLQQAIHGWGNLPVDTITNDLLLSSVIQVYDPSEFTPIYNEGMQYFHPAKWSMGLTLMSQRFQELFERDHGDRVLAYPDLELYSLLQLYEKGDLKTQVRNQLGGFLFEYFSGRVHKGESFSDGEIHTGDEDLDKRILLLAAFSRIDVGSILNCLNACLESGKGSLAAHSLKGGIEYALKNWDESVGWYTRTIELSPEYSYGYFLRGLSYAEMGRMEEAEADLLESLKLYPDHMDATSRLGFIYQVQERNDEAILLFKQSINVYPSNHVIYGAIAYSFEKLEQSDSALYYYDRTIQVQPDDPQAYVSMGNIHHQRGEYSVAVYIFSKALELDPDYIPALTSRGNSYLRQKNFEQAIGDFERSLVIDNSDLYAALRLADCYYFNKLFKEAIPYYENVLEMDSVNYDAYHMLGQIYLELGDDKRAITSLEKSLEIRPDHIPSLTNLGWFLYLKGDYQKCLEYSTKAYALNNEEYVAKFNAALAMLRLGRMEESYSLYRETLEENPEVDLSGAVADLRDLIEHKIMKKEARYVLNDILKQE